MDAQTIDSLQKLLLGGVVSTGLFALCIWFLTRYVKERDDFEKGIKDQIKAIPSKIENTVIDIKEVVSQVKIQQVALSEEIRSHKTQNLEIQKRISDELLKIEKHIITIEATLDRTTAKADKLDSSIHQMNERVQFHDKALSNVIEWAKKTKSQLDDLTKDYKTTTETIKEDLIILKTRKK